MWTKAGIPLDTFQYEYDGKVFFCEEKECSMSSEHYIGHFNYGLNYHMINFNSFTDDGKSIAVFMTDGVGSQYSGVDRASADQVTYDGKVYKLD